MDKRPTVNLYADRDKLSNALSVHIVCLAEMAFAAQGRFSVALSGGSLLDIITPALSSNPLRDKVHWSTWNVFWADERWVPWSSPDSNHGVAEKRFFSRVSIPDGQIHAADDSRSPNETAQAYESALAKAFQTGAGQLPRFDLILLGIGEDGHTASLFPGHPVSNETRRWVVPVLDAPKPPPIRITMTLPVINNARNVVFVAAGSSKTNILSKVFNPGDGRPKLPAQRVNPSNGELRWFLDRAAATRASIHPSFIVEELPTRAGGIV